LRDEGATTVKFRQGFRSMAAPTRELEKLIVSKKLAHGGNPVARWMAANVAVAQDPAGNLKPAKDKSTERIDGIVAIIMALGRAMVVQEERRSPSPPTRCLSCDLLDGSDVALPRTPSATQAGPPGCGTLQPPIFGQRAWREEPSSVGAWRLTRAACWAVAVATRCSTRRSRSWTAPDAYDRSPPPRWRRRR
jgi:hypothetical protein